jgi:hypothetical protein
MAFCLRRGVAGSPGPLWHTRDLQHRPGLAFHERGVYRSTEKAGYPDQYVRAWLLARQRLRRTAVAHDQVPRDLSLCLRQRSRSRPRPIAHNRSSSVSDIEWQALEHRLIKAKGKGKDKSRGLDADEEEHRGKTKDKGHSRDGPDDDFGL